MSDKLRRTSPLSISFIEGELPTAAKLNALNDQLRAATLVLETAIGDLWNQAGDPVLSPSSAFTANALHQTNLARSLGDMSLLNTMLVGTTGSGPLNTAVSYIDDVGNRYGRRQLAYTKYKPLNTPSAVNITITNASGNVVQAQYKSTPYDVIVSGDWHMDTNGKIYTYSPILPATLFEYVPTITSDSINGSRLGGPGWNFIPDPRTTLANSRYNGIKISFANGVDNSAGYHIWLPPRKSMVTYKEVARTPSNSNNFTATPEVAPIRMHQTDTADAALIYGDNYRYNFPTQLQSLSAGTVLPAGFLYIWDETTGTIIEGVTFTVCATAAHTKWKVVATGSRLADVFGTSVGAIVTSNVTQVYTDYIERFKIITAANTTNNAVYNLEVEALSHDHSNDAKGALVSHASLKDLVTPEYSTTNPYYPTNVESLTPSRWLADDHSQYLHRAGSTNSSLTQRDSNDNAVWNLIKIITTGGQTLYLEATDSGSQALMYVSAGTSLTLSNSDAGAGLTLNDNTADTAVLVGRGGVALHTVHVTKPIAIEYPTIFDQTAIGKLYFSTNTTYSAVLAAALPDSWLQYQSATFKFYTNSVLSDSIVHAGSFRTESNAYNYESTLGKLQTLHIPAYVGFDDTVVGNGTLSVLAYGIENTHVSQSGSIYIPLNLPNGAIFRTTNSLTVKWRSNGGASSTNATLFSVDKGATSTTTPSETSLIGFTTTSATTVSTAASPASDITINNSATGKYLYLRVDLAANVTSAAQFYHATLTYYLPTVNN